MTDDSRVRGEDTLMKVIGLMSGTSADGIDAALMEIRDTSDGRPALQWEVFAHTTLPHSPNMREEILACMRKDTGTVDRICALNVALGEAFADAALQVARMAKFEMNDVDVIGSHGQTVWHIPGRATLQIGEPAVIAERTGTTVVSNFRARDIAAGGQGAPLVALVDAMLLSHPTKMRAAQNIGGIGNVTFLPSHKGRGVGVGGEGVAAFDTGPGNMLIDDATRRMTNGAMQCDEDGRIAARGVVHGELLESLMAHPYLQEKPPKTTGRETFGAQFGEQVWREAAMLGLRPEDIVATLTMFTALTIAEAYRDFLPKMPDEVIVSGGGVRNPTLMQMLRAQLGTATTVMTSDEVGMPSAAKEAMAFAILAYLTVHGRPGNLPSATGATHAVVLGDITPSQLDRHSREGGNLGTMPPVAYW